MPQLESRTRVKVDSFTDFELLNDQERVERIRLVLTQFTGVDEKHDYKCRDRALVEYRQLLAYLLRRYTSLSLEEIGFIIGRKDHATTIHSVKTIKNAIEWDKGYAAKVERIINEL
jgi:chromosomal replication initiator protein